VFVIPFVSTAYSCALAAGFCFGSPLFSLGDGFFPPLALLAVSLVPRPFKAKLVMQGFIGMLKIARSR